MDGPFLVWWEVETGVMLVIAVSLFYVALLLTERRKSIKQSPMHFEAGSVIKQSPSLGHKVLPSSRRFPLIGHLHLLNGEPFVEMTKLAQEHGEIYFMQLGTVKTVVVSSFRLIKQVLVEKGEDFGDRTNFLRYNILFGNDKENSLAFCNWSQVQKTRRALARRFCHSPVLADRLDTSLDQSAAWLSTQIHEHFSADPKTVRQHGHVELKTTLHKACANAFFSYFCSERFEDPEDKEFGDVVELFDEIFYEINQGHPTDVLPYLAPFYRSHLHHLGQMGTTIRDFVVRRIIEPHMAKLDVDNPLDFVDILLVHLKEGEAESRLTMDQVLYELEDFLGGHAAVGNLLVRALVEIGGVAGLSQKIHKRCVQDGDAHYMQALIYETLRKSSSPIVPHVASVDTQIDGYPIEKGTMIVLNNFELNTSPKLWTNPTEFSPERFLTDAGTFRKPAHFLPFSTGKRACMGYKMVEKITEGLLIAIIKDFDIMALENPNVLPRSCVAVHPQLDIRIQFVARQTDL